MTSCKDGHKTRAKAGNITSFHMICGDGDDVFAKRVRNKPTERGHRTNLNKGAESVASHISHDPHPVHGRRDLFSQKVFNLFRSTGAFRITLSGNIRIDGQRRRINRQLVHHLTQRLGRRLYNRTVKSVAYWQRNRPYPFFLTQDKQVFHCLCGSSDHGLGWAVSVRRHNHSLNLAQNLFDRFLIRQERCHGAIVIDLYISHLASTTGNNADRIFQVHNSSRRHSTIFTKTVTSYTNRLDTKLFHYVGQGHIHGQNCGLRVHGKPELLLSLFWILNAPYDIG